MRASRSRDRPPVEVVRLGRGASFVGRAGVAGTAAVVVVPLAAAHAGRLVNASAPLPNAASLRNRLRSLRMSRIGLVVSQGYV
jgi:hypothetical protein